MLDRWKSLFCRKIFFVLWKDERWSSCLRKFKGHDEPKTWLKVQERGGSRKNVNIYYLLIFLLVCIGEGWLLQPFICWCYCKVSQTWALFCSVPSDWWVYKKLSFVCGDCPNHVEDFPERVTARGTAVPFVLLLNSWNPVRTSDLSHSEVFQTHCCMINVPR